MIEYEALFFPKERLWKLLELALYYFRVEKNHKDDLDWKLRLKEVWLLVQCQAIQNPGPLLSNMTSFIG